MIQRPQHRLNFTPLPHGQGSLRLTILLSAFRRLSAAHFHTLPLYEYWHPATNSPTLTARKSWITPNPAIFHEVARDLLNAPAPAPAR